jgi:phosphoribosylformimino-5-aminoimidazole carboxamide ribotide isomerase
LRVIPVIDIINGVAVHAVRGRRSEYHPLKSVLCTSADPLDIASAFKAVGFSELYVADLDAIMGGHPNFSVLKQIANTTGLRLMVDAGIADLERTEKLLNNSVSKVIIGTETLHSLSFLKEAVAALGKERVVVSLDLKGEQVLSRFKLGTLGNPLSVMQKIQESGVEQIILLDLARVGSSEGVNMPLLKEMLKNKKLTLLIGGGVRDITDLLTLKNVGVFGVLVATALHSGKITLAELKQAGLLS